ncbi:hypothetical protein DSCO28_31950 [Desulfosarcina ovata subsp. sediminis]|uniref:Uncharacterized protein n=1 Tax=Desulfosarcina ovata subsp. sediminis TaxID=885957 RepID=A0A5K7ZQI8_9BACT|nr:hypothetical protein [Desulfosarcina ovata]BBO82629.1 hypothetical protein DSCO28_31950 [Desulfosarcina ovata subsp. sediminis]
MVVKEEPLLVDPHESVRLAVDAVETDDTPEAKSALREALMRSHLRARLRANGRIVEARFGPSGERVLGTVCGADDGDECMQALWEATTGRLICSLPTGERGRFSTDGDRIVGEGGHVFTADGCAPVAVDPTTVSPAVAPPPRYELAIIEGRPVIRDLESGKTRSLSPYLDPVAGAAFDHEGRFAVTWSASDVYMEWHCPLWRGRNNRPRFPS